MYSIGFVNTEVGTQDRAMSRGLDRAEGWRSKAHGAPKEPGKSDSSNREPTPPSPGPIGVEYKTDFCTSTHRHCSV